MKRVTKQEQVQKSEEKLQERVQQLEELVLQATDLAQAEQLQGLLDEARKEYEWYQLQLQEKRARSASKKKVLNILVPLVLSLLAVGVLISAYLIFFKKPSSVDKKVSETVSSTKVEKSITSSTKSTVMGTPANFQVDVDRDDIPIYAEPSEQSEMVVLCPKGTYRIEATEGKWGKLQKGLGWINLDSLKQTSTSSVTSPSSNETPTEGKLWNHTKAAQLQQYVINEWGPELGQSYQSYTPQNSLNFNGITVPNDLLNPSGDLARFTSMIPDFSGRTPFLVWSETGEVQPNQTALVAVYSDREATSGPTSHLYFFTIEAGNPQVWITEQTQGNPEHKLYFRETANEALRSFFVDLVQ